MSPRPFLLPLSLVLAAVLLASAGPHPAQAAEGAANVPASAEPGTGAGQEWMWLGGDLRVTPEQYGLLTGQFMVPNASQAGVATWPGGIVPYEFDASVPTARQRLFLDAAREWESVVGVQFTPRTGQTVYLKIIEDPTANGGYANLGRWPGGPNTLGIGPAGWTRYVLLHEIGHALGLIHEHQRSDRDSYISIVCANVSTPDLCTNPVVFGKITNSLQTGLPYDFLSIMHYFPTAFQAVGAGDTIEAKPAYQRFAKRFGSQYYGFLSPGDRKSISTLLGYGPPKTALSPVVTNTRDSGPGSLRAALYYAEDHPGATITFAIPASDPGYANGVFTLKLSAQINVSSTGTIVDGGSQKAHTGDTNPGRPVIHLRPHEENPAHVAFAGLIMRGVNCRVSGLNVSGFPLVGMQVDGDETTGNQVTDSHVGLAADGVAAQPNAQNGLVISGDAQENLIGPGNVISGNSYYGIAVHGQGTTDNRIEGNLIGLGSDGETPVPNGYSGIGAWDGATRLRIGGASAAARNYICSNASEGIALMSNPGTPGTGHTIQGNWIGLSPGRQTRGNAQTGIHLGVDIQQTQIGGTQPGEGNVIVASGTEGVLIYGQDITIQGNWIGVRPDGVVRGNGGNGVRLLPGAQRVRIGGVSPGAANVMRGNAFYGVYPDANAGGGHEISANSLFGNTYHGIALGAGVNRNIPAPTLTSASLTTTLNLQGAFSGTAFANEDLRFEIFANPPPLPTWAGGTWYLGANTVRANASGSASFTFTASQGLPPGSGLTATVTAVSTHETSQFSTERLPTRLDPDGDGLPSEWETLHSLNPNSNADRDLDTDRDGYSHYQEYLLGSSPRIPGQPFQLRLQLDAPRRRILTLQGGAGLRYVLEQSLEPGPAAVWQPLTTPATTTGLLLDVTDSTPPASRSFYRARLLP